ncbi:diguanylate cyclase domain-containing protein [Acinetobacter baumannii]|uniref:diguanylate cyclase domain-containing protein n=1 Tax=Acinetobacter baumannii TaxID=470 RepID=UPI003A8C0E63
MLKHFAAQLREHIRATDMAARIGGEEFAVLLEAASIEDAPSMGGAISSGRCDDSGGVWRGVDQL